MKKIIQICPKLITSKYHVHLKGPTIPRLLN